MSEENLPLELYQLIARSVPIVCVDIILVKQFKYGWRIGIIQRATGPETGKAAIIGGRVRHNESLDAAISRHLKDDCGIARFDYIHINSANKPFYIQEYLHEDYTSPTLGYDPTKHSIALTYLISTSDKPSPKNEASSFKWISENKIPKTSAYNHHIIMHHAFDALKQSEEVPM